MNIATYIAYLVGDSNRLVIPNYDPGPLLMSAANSSVNFVYNNPTEVVHDIEHPEGVEGIVGQGVAAVLSPIGWVGSLHSLTQGESYTLTYNISSNLSTSVYGLQPYNEPSTASTLSVPKHVFENWINQSIIKISKLMPRNLKLNMTGTKVFTAGEIDSGGTLPISDLDSNDIISIVRFDGDTAYECRQIPNHLRNKAAFGSGFLDECSVTAPVYYLDSSQKIVVLPKPYEDVSVSGSGNFLDTDGYCEVDYVKYPDFNIGDYDISGVPTDVQEIIYIDVAVKVKRFEINSIPVPISPALNPKFRNIELDTLLQMML